MTELDRELGSVLAGIRAGHDVIPFMAKMLPAADVRLATVPDDMMLLLRGSADFQALEPGAIPTWVRVFADTADADEAELILYRARADGRYYVVAPNRAAVAGV
jgi:hypothetical protein